MGELATKRRHQIWSAAVSCGIPPALRTVKVRKSFANPRHRIPLSARKFRLSIRGLPSNASRYFSRNQIVKLFIFCWSGRVRKAFPLSVHRFTGKRFSLPFGAGACKTRLRPPGISIPRSTTRRAVLPWRLTRQPALLINLFCWRELLSERCG